MAKIRTNTATAQIVDAFQRGEEFTSVDISYIFGVANPTASIAYVRKLGYPIYSNRRKTGSRAGLTFYKMGKPRKLASQIAYKILGTKHLYK